MASQQHIAQQLKAERLAQGRCPQHPKENILPGRKSCHICRDRQRQRYDNKKKNGKCVNHPSIDALSGISYCQSCSDQKDRRRLALIAANKCAGHPNQDAVPGKTLCQECLDVGSAAAANRQKLSRLLGNCPAHPSRKVVAGKKSCQDCLNRICEAVKTRNRERNARGMCKVHKDRPVAPGNTTKCLECKLHANIRVILKQWFKSKSAAKTGHTLEYIGCSWQEFKEHLESQFKPGMTWENHGFGTDKWHLDHRTPKSSFNVYDLESAKQAWHYTNLQPLWQHENLTKGTKK